MLSLGLQHRAHLMPCFMGRCIDLKSRCKVSVCQHKTSIIALKWIKISVKWKESESDGRMGVEQKTESKGEIRRSRVVVETYP